MYGYIYKTTNLKNTKIYIGKHKSNSFDFNYYGSGKIIRRAFKKYGKDSFKVELLEECESLEELNTRERYWIDILDSRNPKIGYNLQFGGTGGWEYVNTYQKGENHPFFSKHLTDLHKQKISQNHMDVSKENNPFYGKTHSEEIKKRISEKAKGRKHSEEAKRKISEKLSGQTRSNIAKKHYSESTKLAWQNKEYRKKHCAAMRGKKRTIITTECPFCKKQIRKCNYNRHIETHLDGRYEEKQKHYHLDHNDLFCKFCNKEFKNRRSLSAHERRCKYRAMLSF